MRAWVTVEVRDPNKRLDLDYAREEDIAKFPLPWAVEGDGTVSRNGGGRMGRLVDGAMCGRELPIHMCLPKMLR